MVKNRLRRGLTESNGIDLETDEIAEQQKMSRAGKFLQHYFK